MMIRNLTFATAIAALGLITSCSNDNDVTDTSATVASDKVSSENREIVPALSATQELEAYALSVEKSTANSDLKFKRVDDSMARTRVNPQDNFVMSLYTVVFTSGQSKYKLKEVKKEGDAAYESNSLKQDAWKAEFCSSHELQRIMTQHKIDFVYGSIDGRDMVITQCGRDAVVSAPVNADSEGNCTFTQRRLMQSFLKEHDLTCDSVSYCGALSPQNIRVTCNNNNYAYKVLDKGAGYYVEFD